MSWQVYYQPKPNLTLLLYGTHPHPARDEKIEKLNEVFKNSVLDRAIGNLELDFTRLESQGVPRGVTPLVMSSLKGGSSRDSSEYATPFITSEFVHNTSGIGSDGKINIHGHPSRMIPVDYAINNNNIIAGCLSQNIKHSISMNVVQVNDLPKT